MRDNLRVISDMVIKVVQRDANTEPGHERRQLASALLLGHRFHTVVLELTAMRLR